MSFLSLSLFISPSSSLSFPGHPSIQSGCRAEMNYGRIRSPVLSKAFSLNPPVQPTWTHICGCSPACPHLYIWASDLVCFNIFYLSYSTKFPVLIRDNSLLPRVVSRIVFPLPQFIFVSCWCLVEGLEELFHRSRGDGHRSGWICMGIHSVWAKRS